jgi:predicted transcriptional regulator
MPHCPEPEHHMSDLDQTTLVEMTTEVVAAYVAQNSVPPAEMPGLIASVHAAFGSLGRVPEPQAPVEPLKPAVPIKKSVTDEFIISLEDGRKMKSMKRYLSGLGMTPADYRTKWGLPKDYPMVAPAYAAKRSELAKSLGLGSLRKRQSEVVEAAPDAEVQPEPALRKPGRRGSKSA